MHREVCGVLLGNLCFDNEPFLLIDARIEGKFATHQSGSVTFTSETWDYINNERESKHPNRKIIGWYHTHPGFGIFLSNMDAFIHHNFFSQSWQTAYVFDPQAETDGFFFAQGESLVQEEVVIVPDEAPVEVKSKTASTAEKIVVLPEEEENRQKTRRFSTIILAAAICFALVMSGFGVFLMLERKDYDIHWERWINANDLMVLKLSYRNYSGEYVRLQDYANAQQRIYQLEYQLHEERTKLKETEAQLKSTRWNSGWDELFKQSGEWFERQWDNVSPYLCPDSWGKQVR